MKTPFAPVSVRVLIVDDSTVFFKKIQSRFKVCSMREECKGCHIVVHKATSVSVDIFYDFYILCNSSHIMNDADNIRKNNEECHVYLHDSASDAIIPVRSLTRCNIADCLDDEESINKFVQRATLLCAKKAKIFETSRKLDHLRNGELDSLPIKQNDSEKFIDFIQNHPLPMVLVSKELSILHANRAMEKIIGSKIPHGSPSTSFWADLNEYDQIIFDLQENGQILNRKVNLKNIHGEHFQASLYSNLHRDRNGNWLNTRCLFVPTVYESTEHLLHQYVQSSHICPS